MADAPTRPAPEDSLTAARWKHTGTRRAILEGNWKEAAATRLQQFFAPEALSHLPPAELAFNPALSVVGQLSTLYDEAGTVETETGTDEDMALAVTPEWWACQQMTLEFVVGLNDCFVLALYSESRGLYYEIVTPDDCEVVHDPDQPDQPAMFRRYLIQRRPGEGGENEWTRTTWDVRPDGGLFKVEAWVSNEGGAGEWEDVTALYEPKLEGRYPFVLEGQPVMPAVAYHRRLWKRILTTLRGMELFEGTLTTSSLMTYWVGGVRDGAHPQRYMMDAASSTKAVTTHAAGTEPGIAVIKMDRMSIMQLRSLGGSGGSVGQWNPTMDPKSAGESIAAYAAQLAVYAGISPSDVSIKGGSTGQSGYAISISRDGQRRARKKLIPPMRRADELLFATAARVLQVFGKGMSLPTDPEDWTVRYADLPKSLEEVRAELEEARVLREAGVLGLVDHFLRFHPGMTREQAMEKMTEDAREERALEAAITALAPKEPTPAFEE